MASDTTQHLQQQQQQQQQQQKQKKSVEDVLPTLNTSLFRSLASKTLLDPSKKSQQSATALMRTATALQHSSRHLPLALDRTTLFHPAVNTVRCGGKRGGGRLGFYPFGGVWYWGQPSRTHTHTHIHTRHHTPSHTHTHSHTITHHHTPSYTHTITHTITHTHHTHTHIHTITPSITHDNDDGRSQRWSRWLLLRDSPNR